jgi:hypothetical protein
MATPSATEEPTFTLEFSNDLTNLHNHTTVGDTSILDHVPIHVCLSTDDKSDIAPTYEATRTVETRVLGGGTSSPCRRIPSI